MNNGNRQVSRWVYSFVRLKSLLLGFLILCLGFFPGFFTPGNTQTPSDMGVLVQDGDQSTVPRSVAALLVTLKQINPDFSTIQLKELTNFKGKTLVVPLNDETSKTFLDTLVRDKPQETRLVVLPMLTQPNAEVENFLQRLGFSFDGTQYLSESMPLTEDGKEFNTYIPIGSFVYKVSSAMPIMATWGESAPAAVISGRAMLINWNWNSSMPGYAMSHFLDEWQTASPSETASASSPSSGDAVNKTLTPALSWTTVPNAETAPGEAAPKILASDTPSKPQMVIIKTPTSSRITYTTTPPQPRVIKPQANYSFIPADSGEAQPADKALQALPAMPAPQSTNGAALPSTVSSTAVKAMPGINTDDRDDDTNPAELYEYDGAGKMDKETARARRSVETQNAMADYYNDRMREFGDLSDKVNLLAGEYLNHPEKYAKLKATIDEANHQKSRFETLWFQQNFGPALAAFENSKDIMMTVLFDKIPGSQIEGRAIWLDRGSIIKAANADGLRQLIRRIAASGFNIIYFETINAGYPIYPSSIVEQNPQTKGWDPLAVAIDEAHKQGVELHAWVWAFAVGNTRHNRLLGLPDSYPGPILSKPEMATEALKGRNGELVLPEQYEYWLSPASFKARNFLTTLYSEIVRNYKVDGLQLDYIRYPFQKPNTPMGFEPFAMARFTSETGLSLDAPNEYTAKAWDAWKAFQVTTFVKDLHQKLKSINPDLKLSAAVFPIARHGRMLMIQQDWETWVRNGWVDTINPMAYSRSPRSLERLVEYIHNIGEDKALVYPGLSLSKLNAITLLDALEICRNSGVMGTTLFAVTQFDNDKQLLLQTGPYKQRKAIPPHRDPMGSSEQMINEAKLLADNLLKSDEAKPGIENLQQIDDALKTIGEAVHTLHSGKKVADSEYLLGAVQDDTRMLKQHSEQWAEWSSDSDSVVSFQARYLKLMVDKVVRMVNYATFEYTASQKSGNSFVSQDIAPAN